MIAAVIACRTIEPELLEAMKRAGTDYPVLWLESGLHNTPAKLRRKLTELLETVGEGSALLAMGSCGNSLAGVCSRNAELIVPKVDDCISLLLGSMERRQRISSELAAYFLTEGWMRGERNLWVEYQHSVKKYGEEKALMIAQMMYEHYRTLALVDCGTTPVERLAEESAEIARILSLKQEVVPGTLSYLEELLTGPWTDARFVRKPPGVPLEAWDFL